MPVPRPHQYVPMKNPSQPPDGEPSASVILHDDPDVGFVAACMALAAAYPDYPTDLVLKIIEEADQNGQTLCGYGPLSECRRVLAELERGGLMAELEVFVPA